MDISSAGGVGYLWPAILVIALGYYIWDWIQKRRTGQTSKSAIRSDDGSLNKKNILVLLALTALTITVLVLTLIAFNLSVKATV
jgi:uncharacterized membrane protein